MNHKRTASVVLASAGLALVVFSARYVFFTPPTPSETAERMLRMGSEANRPATRRATRPAGDAPTAARAMASDRRATPPADGQDDELAPRPPASRREQRRGTAAEDSSAGGNGQPPPAEQQDRRIRPVGKAVRSPTS